MAGQPRVEGYALGRIHKRAGDGTTLQRLSARLVRTSSVDEFPNAAGVVRFAGGGGGRRDSMQLGRFGGLVCVGGAGRDVRVVCGAVKVAGGIVLERIGLVIAVAVVVAGVAA